METVPLDVRPTSYPIRRRSARTYLAGPEFVVASRRTGRCFALNETASALWERCDGSQSVQAIAATLAHTFGRSEDEVLVDIQALLTDLHTRGFVAVHAPATAAQQVERPGVYHVTFLRHTVEIETDDPGVAKNIRRIFGGLLSETPGTVVGRMAVFADGDQYRTLLAGVEQSPQTTLRRAVTWLKRQGIRALVGSRSDLLWLHAGAVAKNGRVLLCLGQGGSGKSTLVMSLVDEGWSYLSDDVLAYDPVTGGALAFPLAPFYRVWGEELVDDINVLDKIRFEQSPDSVAKASLSVAALVFPTFSAEGEARLTPRGPGAATVGLSRQALNDASHAGDPLHAFADLAGRVPAYDLVHTPQAPPVSLIRPLLQGW